MQLPELFRPAYVPDGKATDNRAEIALKVFTGGYFSSGYHNLISGLPIYLLITPLFENGVVDSDFKQKLDS